MIGRAAPVLVVLVAAVVRLYGLTAIGLNSDEAVYSGQAASIAGDAILSQFFPIFRAHPLLIQTMLAVALSVENSDLAARLVAAGIGIATIVVVYLLGALLYGRRIGLVAALFVAVMPYHVIVTRQFLLDGPLTLLTTVTLYCLARFGMTNRHTWLYASSAMLGLAFLTKETAIVFIAATYAFLALAPALVVGLRHLAVAMLTMALVIACFPLSLLLAGGGGASTAQQYFVWQLLRRPNHDLLFYPTIVPPALGIVLLAVALVSLWVFRARADWRLRLLVAWMLVPVTFFELWPTKGFQYLLPVAPVVAILAARLLIEWRPQRGLTAPGWLHHSLWQPRAVAVTLVVASLLVPSAATVLGPAPGQVLAGGGGVPGGREAGQWVDTNLPPSARLMTIGPSMGNILQFYGHRTTRALSVSPDPLKRNPSYEPIRNADLSVRTGEFRYLVWDAYSAARTPHFSGRLMELVRRYDGRLVHAQALSSNAGGSQIETPIIQIYEVRAPVTATQAESAPPPAAGAPVRREFIFASYGLAVVIAAGTVVIAIGGGLRGRRVARSSVRLAMCLALTAAWLLGPPTVRAATPTTLTMETDTSITVGVHPSVTVRLAGPAGPIARTAVEVQLDGRQTMRVVTDSEGAATTVVARDLDAGDYELQAVFRGTDKLIGSSSAVQTLHVAPATLIVRTVPLLAGVPVLRVDGRPMSTGADGTIHVAIPAVRRYRLEVMLPPEQPDLRLTFDRWGDGNRDKVRSIRLPGRSELVLGLERMHRVQFGFVDASGTTVDPARVETLLIANDRGEVLEPSPGESTWLVENRIMRVGGELSSVPIEYRIQEVGVRGSNVVDRGRLHHQPSGELDTWLVPLLLYSVAVSGQDALFGYPLGSSVQLSHPNGSVESIPLDQGASVTVTALPRGNYKLAIEHPPGFAVSTPLVLSREQHIRVPVISYVDAAFVLGTGSIVAVGLVLAGGRPVGRAGRRMLRQMGGAVLTTLLLPLRLARAIARRLGEAAGGLRRRAHLSPRTATPFSPIFEVVPVAPVAGGAVTMDAGVEPAASTAGFSPPPQERVRRYKRCRHCGRQVTWRARLCRACGERLRRS